jgi:protein pelota
MKQLNSHLKKGELKIKVDNTDDLWYLTQIIEPNDSVSGKTVRKIKIGGEEQRSAKVIKKKVYVAIVVEKLEFSGEALRISGKITEGPEDIPRGVYHTITLEPGTTIRIHKEHWFSYQLGKVKQACREKPTNILICLMDREEAYMARLKTKGYELLAHLKGEVQKKQHEQAISKNFYAELEKALKDYDSRSKFTRIIIASPSFWKDELMERLKEKELKDRIILATASSVSTAGLNEVLRRPEVLSALHDERITEEVRMVEELLDEIAKDGKSVYGPDQVKGAVEAGAVKTLLITERYLKDSREDETFNELEELMRMTEQLKGEVHLISTEHEAGKKLHGLGGIAGLLRYRLTN